MKLKQRWVRWIAAGAMVSIIATQIPFTNTKAAVAADYTNTGGDTSDNFLGISGLKNRDVVESAVVAITLVGAVGAVTGGLTETTPSDTTLASGTGSKGASHLASAPTKSNATPLVVEDAKR